MAISQQIKCESCDQMYPASKSRCPHCGARRSVTARRGGMTSNAHLLAGIAIVVVIMIVVITLIIINLNNKDERGIDPSSSPNSGIDSVTSSPNADATSTPLPTNTVEVETIVFLKVENGMTLMLPEGAEFTLGDSTDDQGNFKQGLMFSPAPPEGETVWVKWESSDTSVAIVNPVDGKVTAISEGTCIITASVGSAFRELTVTVVPVGQAYNPTGTSQPGSSTPPSSSTAPAGTIKLSHIDVTLSVSGNKTYGKTFTLKANGGTDGVYYSTDDKIATVDDKGKVTAVKKGTCKITVTLNGASASCDIRVRD